MSWQDRALCAETDPELFFPVGSGGHYKIQIAEAKAVCAACPVRPDCLGWITAVERGDARKHRAGIWGGTTGDERFEMEQAAQEVAA